MTSSELMGCSPHIPPLLPKTYTKVCGRLFRMIPLLETPALSTF